MTSITEPDGSTRVEQLNPELKGLRDRYEFGWADSDAAGAAATRGLNEAVVSDISEKKEGLVTLASASSSTTEGEL